MFRDIRKGKRRKWNENVFVRPNALRENAVTAISCRGPGSARKKREVPGIPVIGKRRKMHICALVAKHKEAELTLRRM